MDSALTLILVAVAAALAGGCAAALSVALALRGEDRRFESKLADVRNGLEDLDDRLLQWQRKVTKRERDALRSPRSPDLASPEAVPLPLSLRDRMAQIRLRAMR